MLTSVFLHIGFVHLAFNVYALHIFGQVSEKIVGKWFFLAIFLLSGIGGNVLNNAYAIYTLLHSQPLTSMPAMSAGASGGIMGLGAALLVASAFKLNVHNTMLNTKALMWIMGINLMLGFAIPNIDNAGHIGGAITGALMTAIFAMFFKAKQSLLGKWFATAMVTVLFTALVVLWKQHYSGFLMQILQS